MSKPRPTLKQLNARIGRIGRREVLRRAHANTERLTGRRTYTVPCHQSGQCRCRGRDANCPTCAGTGEWQAVTTATGWVRVAKGCKSL